VSYFKYKSNGRYYLIACGYVACVLECRVSSVVSPQEFKNLLNVLPENVVAIIMSKIITRNMTVE
jgi:hypothetical protein